RELKATRIIDIATLTGAILITLGHTYTGVWVNCDKLWEKLETAAKDADELIWRLPLHEEFAKNIRKSEVADLKNADLTRKAGSCSAAMFLKEFTEDKEFIHFDIAGTAIVGEKAASPMIKTITH
ncbi:MAG: leucyl aminopeptidase family protein, partial [Mycoplasma sp.]|nr:leucyl aminopeptidase family protein [Mycoplasma sp.]